jgi:hypothetical protein
VGVPMWAFWRSHERAVQQRDEADEARDG